MSNKESQTGGKHTNKTDEDEMFVLVDKKNPITKPGTLVSSYDDPPHKDNKSAKKANDGFETVPVFGIDPNQQSKGGM
jgi:hypothetical protein